MNVDQCKQSERCLCLEGWSVCVVCLKGQELTFDQSLILIEQHRALTGLWERQLTLTEPRWHSL